MSGLDKREKDFENKFAHDEVTKFKIAARRRKLLGLWVAEHMKLADEAGLQYALELVQYGIDNQQPGAVIGKILNDAAEKGVTLSEVELRQKNEELEIIATRQIKEQG